MAQRITVTLLSFFAHVAFATEEPQLSEPFKIISQQLYVARIPGYYHSSFGTTMPYPDQFYTLSVDVGTPAKTLNLTLDSVWKDTVLIADDYGTNGGCLKNEHQPARSYYNSSASSTFRSVDAFPLNATFSEKVIYGSPKCKDDFSYGSIMVHDNLQISQVDLGDAVFDVAWNVPGDFNPNWKSDGIFPYFPRDYVFVWKMPEPTISVFINRVDAKQEEGVKVGGRLVIGGQDVDNCDTHWTPSGTKLRHNERLSFRFSSFAIGGARLHINGSGELHFTTSYIHAPPDAFAVITTAVQAEYDDENAMFYVDCAMRKFLPDIVFSLASGPEYRIPPQDYAREVTNGDGQRCTLMFRACTERRCLEEGLWRIGTTFNRPYCIRIRFDKDSAELQFAKVRHHPHVELK